MKNTRYLIMAFSAAALLLYSCGSEEPSEPTPVPPTETLEPTPIPPTETPEPTPVPPTETPEPEPTETSEASNEKTVLIVDNAFVGGDITVLVGTTVIWAHDADRPHTATSDDGTFKSGDLQNGDTFSFTFEEAGTFNFYCEYHGGPNGQDMSGTIIVTDE